MVRLSDCDSAHIAQLLSRFGLVLQLSPVGEPIPGSYWGDEEAGLKNHEVFARDDTPLHSILHEACHFICMDPHRRHQLDTDAGGHYDEENAVCYLQILLADFLPGMGRRQMMEDMDEWGYTFRLGSAAKWFDQDADDARSWLLENDLIDGNDQPTFRLRQSG